MINHTLLPKAPDDLKIGTSCNKCIFKIASGDIQTGCRFNDRINKFLDVQDIDVYTTESEDGETHCIINSVCNACTQKVPDKHKDEDVEFVKDVISKQLEVIILMEENTTIEQLVKTYRSTINQELKPSRVIISYRENNDKSINPNLLYTVLQDPSVHVEGVRFFIVRSMPDISWDEHIISCVNKCETPFFALFEAGETVPYNLASTIDDLVNMQMMRFVSIAVPSEKKELSGAVVLTRLFRKVATIQRLNEKFELDVKSIIHDLTHTERSLQWNI